VRTRSAGAAGPARAQAKAAQPMVESLLRGLKQAPELQGPLGSELLDAGDAVAAWTGANLAAVLFPTAETLRQARALRLARGPVPRKHTAVMLAAASVQPGRGRRACLTAEAFRRLAC